jgi:transcriptional regulator with PAS, ATPase and Fis domain
MPLLLQAKLLRVIQESEIERVGGKKPIRVNVRLIATTNRSLQEMVEAGQFREDLYYRLNVIPMEIPPLRQRFKDIELLSQLFVEMAAAENGVPVKALSKSAMQTLSTWDWPGNVRELQNVMERSLLLSKGPTIEASDVAITEKRRSKNEKSLKPGMTVSEVEKMLILKTLDFTEQNRTKAAQLLGISIRTLRNKINEYKQVGV